MHHMGHEKGGRWYIQKGLILCGKAVKSVFKFLHCQFLLIASHTLSSVLFIEGFPEWIAFRRFTAKSEVSVLKFYMGFVHWIIPESLCNHSNNFCDWTPKLEAKLAAYSLQMWQLHNIQVHSTASHCWFKK